jgi:hypothetical protein
VHGFARRLGQDRCIASWTTSTPKSWQMGVSRTWMMTMPIPASSTSVLEKTLTNSPTTNPVHLTRQSPLNIK